MRKRDVEQAIKRLADVDVGVVVDFNEYFSDALERFLSSSNAARRIADELRDDIADHVGQAHDFVQLAKLVRGYAIEILKDRRPDVDTVEAAEALPNEGAIYFSTELMVMKLDALQYIKEPNLAFGGERIFPIHQFLSRYFKIYSWRAREKELDLRIVGECWEKVRYRDHAIGTVIQALLDNLIKYAPAGSKADIRLSVGRDVVKIAFESLGPRIEPNETRKIFLPGYRALAARSIESGGQGIGLASAMVISEALDLNLAVEQDNEPDPKFTARFLTRFTVELTKAESRNA